MPDRAPGSADVWRIARGSVAAFAVYAAGAGLTYCSQLMIARLVGAGGYGVYAYVFAWVTVLAYLSALGFDVSLLRFVPEYLAQQAPALLRGVIRYAERRAAAVGCVIALAGACSVALWAGGLSSELADTFLVGFALVPVWALLWIRGSIVRAFGGVVSALAPDRLVRDGLLILVLAAVHSTHAWRVNAPLAMTATLFSSAVGLGLVSLAKTRLELRAVGRVSPVPARRMWLRAAAPFVLIGAAEAVMNRTGVVLLGWMGDIKGAGVYALIFNIAFLAVLPRTAVNALFAPTVSNLFVRNDRAALQILVGKAASWTLFGAIGIALPLAFLADTLLAWFGRDFVVGASGLRILLIGQSIAAAGGSQLFLMTMTGHERSAAILLITSAVANGALSAALISLFGVTGAAVGMVATLILWNAAMALFVWRRLGLLPSLLGLFRSPPGGAAAASGAHRDALG